MSEICFFFHGQINLNLFQSLTFLYPFCSTLNFCGISLSFLSLSFPSPFLSLHPALSPKPIFFLFFPSPLYIPSVSLSFSYSPLLLLSSTPTFPFLCLSIFHPYLFLSLSLGYRGMLDGSRINGIMSEGKKKPSKSPNTDRSHTLKKRKEEKKGWIKNS